MAGRMAERRQKWLAVLALAGAIATMGVGASGCGGSMAATGPTGPMPTEGSYTGVWHSPQYGDMQFVQTGSQVIGCYVRNERRGRVQGTVQGNLMRFEWSEQREMVVGRPTTTRGHAYFHYAVGDDGDHYIRGEWGADAAERGGGPWNAVRDRRRAIRPDPECSDGDSGAQQRGDSFEGGGTSQGGGGDSFGSGSGSSGSTGTGTQRSTPPDDALDNL